ncbi:hypothetical protein OIDMADRAFT_20051 [Oidiodendron maius Zn]|uniref:WW domain-containing protein n=1 Tax=Oidiodendron maius (strain Zn) TaxID=913774 RepID=A0A0C3H7A4_OIDMZ|nr:hypothetical protein OIDMADRAFT_20051 [Oidiodendron maius Zn]
MDGAAFLGPLPDSFELVKKYSNQDKGDYWAFADRESGKLQVEDPRLAGVRLPAGWRRKKHPGEEFWTWFVNDETREDNGYFDPRLNLDELKSRGVELEAFDLI